MTSGLEVKDGRLRKRGDALGRKSGEIEPMAKFSLRRYETQARASVVIGLASVASLLVLIALFLRNIAWSETTIVYGNPAYRLTIYGAAFITMCLATFGFGFGFNSAGQRRNDKPQLSWTGFFISAAVLCLTIVLLFFFQTRSEVL